MKKPIQKNWWFWLIVVIIVAGIFGNKDEENSKKDEVASTEVSIPTESKSETIVTEKSVAKTQEVNVQKKM
ncbi:hypothetical protein ACIOBL_09830 [Paenibacillus taichungensis]|uniref:hypothetical protein n=1 Tax=Paenibacillus taichungensis TaxID=484184 RepID=UPI00380B23BF